MMDKDLFASELLFRARVEAKRDHKCECLACLALSAERIARAIIMEAIRPKEEIAGLLVESLEMKLSRFKWPII